MSGFIKPINDFEITTKTTHFTLSPSEINMYIRSTSAADINCTVPLNSTIYIPIKSVFTIRQAGAGVITTTKGDASITFNGNVKTNGANSSIQLIKVNTDEWDIVGGVE